MSGPGGLGPLPSSRLTRVLQEKAEALRKKRQTAEAAQKDVDDRLAQLARLGISPPGMVERQEQLRDLARRTDWDALEARRRRSSSSSRRSSRRRSRGSAAAPRSSPAA